MIRRVLVILALVATFARADSQDDIETVGDVLALALPLSAGITSGVKRDWAGLKQWALSWGTSALVVDRMKANVQRQRPSDSSTNGYPSGHVASATSGAAYFQTRYGSAWGIPAYGLAAFTAYSRVQADKHFPGDVLAGFSVSVLLNWAYVRKYPDDWRIFPKKTAQGYALQFDWLSDDEEYFAATDAGPFVRRWRFEWEFGPADRLQNVVQAPSDTGTPVDLADFTEDNNPTWVSRVTIERHFDGRNELALVLAPYGVRDHGEVDEDTRFGNVTFPAGTRLGITYRSYDFLLRYRRNLFPDDSFWILKPGAALTWQYVSAELEDESLDVSDEVSGSVVLPVLHLQGGIRLGEHWQVLAETDWMELGDHRRFDFAAYVRWSFARYWDLSLGWRWMARGNQFDEFSNRVEQQRFLITFGYSW